MKYFVLCFLLFSFIITSCLKEQEKILSESSFKVMGFKKATFPTSFVYKGSVVNGLHWSDKNGENYFLLTEENTKEKYDSSNDWNYKTKFWHGYHFANYNKTEFKLVKEFADFVENCEFDLMQEFLSDYFTITDLDKNNFGEITVIYTKTCTSDVSPQEIILLMFENGTKYAIRGLTSVEVPGLNISGKSKIDASFNKAPAQFKEYALTHFNRAAGIK